MKPYRYRDLKILSLLTVATLALAACGGGDDDASEANPVSDETSEPTDEGDGADEGDRGEESDGSDESDGDDESALRPVEPASITWGTSSQGGLSFVVGASMAEVMTNAIDGVDFNAVVSSGSVENVRLMATGEFQCGQPTSDVAHFAVEGEREFDAPIDNIRFITNQWVSPQNIIVPADSDIESLSDLAGKNITTTPGWGASTFAPAVLAGAGLVEGEDYEFTVLGGADGVSSLRDGTVDAMMAAFGIPTPSVTELASTLDVRFISLSDDEVDTILEEHPYWFADVIPAGTYPGIEEDVQTIANNNVLLCRDDLPDDLVYNMVKVAYEQADAMREAAPSLSVLGTDGMAADAVIEIHPGAEEFYREVGLLD